MVKNFAVDFFSSKIYFIGYQKLNIGIIQNTINRTLGFFERTFIGFDKFYHNRVKKLKWVILVIFFYGNGGTQLHCNGPDKFFFVFFIRKNIPDKRQNTKEVKIPAKTFNNIDLFKFTQLV